MNKSKATIQYILMMAFGSSAIFFLSCSNKSMEGMIIFTRVDRIQKDTNYLAVDSEINMYQSQIMALDPNEPRGSPQALTEEYFSARSPEISNDGRYLLFTARQNQSDHWQIWELRLNDKKLRQVTSLPGNCTYPAYLPGGRLVFSYEVVNDSLKSGNSLYTCNLDGSDIKRITFNPYSYYASTVLKDGRILTISRQLYPVRENPEMMVLRPDGTKAELFYNTVRRNELLTRPCEITDGKIVFIESGKDSLKNGDVISITYNRPLQTRINLSSGIKGDFQSTCPLPSGRLMVSWQPSDANRYGLYEFDPGKRLPERVIYQNNDYDIIEAVIVTKTEMPEKLPSEVDTGVKTGLLLCQDINVINTLKFGNIASSARATMIEVIGIDSSLGIINVEKDGSFYLRVIADKPFQIRAMDEKGRVLNNPCSWIWLRPNERRGCVGCHEDPYQVPENRVPLAVRNSPVSVPVHISKVKEKKVLLE